MRPLASLFWASPLSLLLPNTNGAPPYRYLQAKHKTHLGLGTPTPWIFFYKLVGGAQEGITIPEMLPNDEFKYIPILQFPNMLLARLSQSVVAFSDNLTHAAFRHEDYTEWQLVCARERPLLALVRDPQD